MTTEVTALAALLLAGHFLGDFVLQTTWMVRNKDRARGLFAHVGVVVLAQALLLVPFASVRALVALAVIGVAHTLLDLGKGAIARSAPRPARTWFWLDQLGHGLVLAAAVWWLAPDARVLAGFPIDALALTHLGVLVAVYSFNVSGVSALVEFELARLGIPLAEEGPAAGRTIGILERMFAITLILLNHWEALGFLVAAKSLARFKDLDDRQRAEYYLVGTLVSLFGATVSALAARAAFGHLTP
jgi:hypothetical protein